MQLNPTPVIGSLFSHFPSTKKLVADHSDLNNVQFSQLYDDACDVGLALLNTNTGNVTRWAVSGETRNAESELVSVILEPCTESIRRNAAMHGYKMVILND